jgi:3-methyladenine DNA glycosylase/8-oxoguanine DNA glycosylase
MWGRTYTRRRRARYIRRAAERAAEQARDTEQARDADALARGAVIAANKPQGG